MDITIAQRAKNGAELLDEKFPDWARKMDMDNFDILSVGSCVLGQVYGSWYHGTDDLRLTGDRDRQEFYGFELTHEEYQIWPQAVAEEFAMEWQALVSERI